MSAAFCPDKGSYFTVLCRVTHPNPFDGSRVRDRSYNADVFVTLGVDDRIVIGDRLTPCLFGAKPEPVVMVRSEWDFYPAGPEIIAAVKEREPPKQPTTVDFRLYSRDDAPLGLGNEALESFFKAMSGGHK